MKINVKVISDIHFGKGDDRKLWNELQEIFIPSINDDLDLLIIAGDLFDRVIKLNETTSHYVFKFIDQLSILSKIHDFKIRILKGTKGHDFNQLNNFQNYEKLENGDDNDKFGIANEVCAEEIFDGIHVLYIPEEYMEKPDEYYAEYFSRNYDLIFFHGTMDFAGYTAKLTGARNYKYSPTFKSSQIAEIVDGVAVGGHIHIRDNYKEKIYYCGSFSRFSFGESEEKGFVSFAYDSDTKDVDLEYINNTLAPKYATVNLSDLEGSLEEKLNKIETLKEEYENLRICVSEEDRKGNDEIISAIKNLTDDSVKLKVANSFEEKYDPQFDFIINKTLPLNETIAKYIKITKDKTISKDKIAEILKSEE